jgi:hypothetical protein
MGVPTNLLPLQNPRATTQLEVTQRIHNAQE